MSNEEERAQAEIDAAWARWLGPGAVLIVLLGGAIVWLRFGPPAVVLWFAFASLTGAVLLFWEALRTVLDPGAQGDASPAEALALEDAELRAQKKAALRALKELEFEHSIRRISDGDYAELRERYRADARAAMEALDKGLGAYLDRAEELAVKELGVLEAGAAKGEGETESAKAEPSATTVPAAAEEAGEKREEAPAEKAAEAQTAKAPVDDTAKAADEEKANDARRTCAKCETLNEPDATFCKRCGERMEAA